MNNMINNAKTATLLARFDELAGAAVHKASGSEPQLFRLQEIITRVAQLKLTDDTNEVLQTAITELEKF